MDPLREITDFSKPSGSGKGVQLRKAGYEVIVISRKGGLFTAEKGRI